jgi:hypothetical protein
MVMFLLGKIRRRSLCACCLSAARTGVIGKTTRHKGQNKTNETKTKQNKTRQNTQFHTRRARRVFFNSYEMKVKSRCLVRTGLEHSSDVACGLVLLRLRTRLEHSSVASGLVLLLLLLLRTATGDRGAALALLPSLEQALLAAQQGVKEDAPQPIIEQARNPFFKKYLTPGRSTLFAPLKVPGGMAASTRA